MPLCVFVGTSFPFFGMIDGQLDSNIWSSWLTKDKLCTHCYPGLSHWQHILRAVPVHHPSISLELRGLQKGEKKFKKIPFTASKNMSVPYMALFKPKFPIRPQSIFLCLPWPSISFLTFYCGIPLLYEPKKIILPFCCFFLSSSLSHAQTHRAQLGPAME